MIQKHKYIAAIDPDLNASGVAVWDSASKCWVLAEKVSIENIVSILDGIPKNELIIYVEAGWMNKKSNFRKTKSWGTTEAISMKVGQNHAMGKTIVKILEAAGCTVQTFKPLRKGIFKKSTGWTKYGREYVQEQSGITKRINDEVRDAIYAVLHYR